MAKKYNERYGNWTILKIGPEKNKAWARCDCGTEKQVLLNNVSNGRSKSCGCIRAKNNKQHRPKIIVNKGDTYNNLTIIKEVGTNPRLFRCKCDCGKKINVELSNLRSDRVKSCGCVRTKLASERVTKHGLSHHPLFNVFSLMRSRCYDPNNQDYKHYGDRGISISQSWLNKPVRFVKWGIKNGWESGLQIDRKDNSGNYTPKNCRFVTSKVNNRNKRSNRIVRYKGQRMPLSQAVELAGLNYSTVHYRLQNGWSVKKSLEG